MRPIRVVSLGGVVTLAAAFGACARASAGDAAPSAGCASSEFRQFDFFVGDWDTYDVAAAAQLVARNNVTVTLGGCVLHEVYEQGDGLVGESFSLYDVSRAMWHQSWFTNRGQLLLLDGRWEHGRMVLTGTEPAADGAASLLRGIWRPEGTAVRETAERSSNGGRTWKPMFDILFRPHSGTVTVRTDDAQIVSALDTKYQAAVRTHDVATMDAILADDFVLVTGRGRTYTKADLLQDARSQDVIYQQQEDTSQTVRVWGNTAVVTALLRAKGTDKGKPFDYQLWFSDTYVRTPGGWRYVFAQASLPLP